MKDEQQGSATLVEPPTGHHAVNIIADDPDEFSFPQGFLESYSYSSSDFKFCQCYNDRSMSWHDAIGAMVARCHVNHDDDDIDRSIVSNVSCQTVSKAELLDDDRTQASADRIDDAGVDSACQEYLSGNAKSQSSEHGMCIDRYQMLSTLANMSVDGSLSSVSSTSDVSQPNRVRVISAQQVASSSCVSHESFGVDSSCPSSCLVRQRVGVSSPGVVRRRVRLRNGRDNELDASSSPNADHDHGKSHSLRQSIQSRSDRTGPSGVSLAPTCVNNPVPLVFKEPDHVSEGSELGPGSRSSELGLCSYDGGAEERGEQARSLHTLCVVQN